MCSRERGQHKKKEKVKCKVNRKTMKIDRWIEIERENERERERGEGVRDWEMLMNSEGR